MYICHILLHRSKLQDAVPASPYAEVEETVRNELGRPLSSLFASIEREALASASVAQVHRCTLKDGRQGVIKVKQNRLILPKGGAEGRGSAGVILFRIS